MGLKYNKEYVKRDGRRLGGSSPRDLQRRQAQQSDVYENLIEDLKREINNLKKELQNSSIKKTGMFTAEQLDTEINKIVSGTIKELTVKHNEVILEKEIECKKLVETKEKLLVDLRDQNKLLTEGLCKIKETTDPGILDKLTTLLLEITERTSPNITVKSDRPQIKTVFIDPLEVGAVDALEAHIDVEEVSSLEKEDISEKVTKLRSLMGKLPNNK